MDLVDIPCLAEVDYAVERLLRVGVYLGVAYGDYKSRLTLEDRGVVLGYYPLFACVISST